MSRPVTLAVELSVEIRDPWGNAMRGISARTKSNRKDFGVSWSSTMDGGGLVVSETVEIDLEMELLRK